MSTIEEDSQDGQLETYVERRANPRFPIKININYRLLQKEGRVSVFNHSVSHDIAEGGVAVICDHKIETGQQLILKLYLPYQCGQLKENNTKLPSEADCWTINIMARVVWCRPIGANQFSLGLEFLESRYEDCQLLQDFLNEFKLQSPRIDD